MAERRMFAKRIIDSDLFLEMPLSTQALYFHMSMRADDDGFINNPKRIMRMLGCADDDMRILAEKQFIIPFESGIVVVKHWKIHNYIQKDRYRPSEVVEKSQVLLDDNNVYSMDTTCIQTVVQDGYVGKDRLGKDRLELGYIEGSDKSKPTPSKKFKKPTIEEIKEYCEERTNNINAEQFYDFYESKGWKVGNSLMKDWKASVRTWEKRDCNTSSQQSQKVDYTAGLVYGVDYL